MPATSVCPRNGSVHDLNKLCGGFDGDASFESTSDSTGMATFTIGSQKVGEFIQTDLVKEGGSRDP